MSNDPGAGPGSIRPSGNLFHEVRAAAAASSSTPGDAALPTGDAAIRADERARCFAILSSGYVPGREVEALRLALFTDIPASQATFAMGSVPTTHRKGTLTPPAGYAERTAAAPAHSAAAVAPPASGPAADPRAERAAARNAEAASDLTAAVTACLGRVDQGSAAERVPARDDEAAGDLTAAVTAHGGRTE